MKHDFRLQPPAFRLVVGVLPFCLLTLALAANAVAVSPYDSIVGRNVFGLKPPATNAPPPVVNPAAAVTIKLQGISTILGRRQVLLKVNTAARPPEPAREQSYLLNEGERDGELEVVEIDALNGIVKLKNNDEPLSLSMQVKDDVVRPAVGAALPAPANPAQIGQPPPPNPGPSPAGGNPRTIPTRSLRTGGAGVGDGAAPGSAAANLTPPPSIASQRSVEENVALYEINRAKNEALIKSGVRLPRMPPHVLIQQPQEGNTTP